jgi:hypothetical protein
MTPTPMHARRTQAAFGAATIASLWSVIAATLVLAACSVPDVPYFTAPTSVPTSPAGVQNALTGLFGGTEADAGFIATYAGFGRDAGEFTNADARGIQYPLGVTPYPNAFGGVWVAEYQNVLQAQEMLAAIPHVSPAYSAAQAASLSGIIRTVEALNYMMVAEAHDTLGIAILPASHTGVAAPPAVCNKDAWAYIVALLDSANDSLVIAGSAPPPVQIPTGYGGVSTSSGPGTQLGSFASFNRALAAKANLEQAYAIARTPTSGSAAPTPTTRGSPDVPSLNTALADLAASAMYNPGALAPTPAPQFVAGPYTVVEDFSSQSGAPTNPYFSSSSLVAMLNDFVADVDTAHDLRWKAKITVNPFPVQLPVYNVVASKYTYNMYPGPSAPIPVVREEELVLWHAQIELGLGNLAAALADVNEVRTAVGGLPPFPPSVASTYTSMRDSLMKEQRISTTFELSGDRTIAIRMYGMAAVSDTTWLHEDPQVTTGDFHTTISPLPQTELDGRDGTFITTCR